MKAVSWSLLLIVFGAPVAHAEHPSSADTKVDAPTEEAPSAAPTEAGSEITLHWKARQEERAYGYLVYRAERREGPYRRVSDRIIRVDSDDGDAASAYRWTDRDVIAGTTYYYYLDIVSIGGIKQRFSGVLSRAAPNPEAPEAPRQADEPRRSP